MLTIAIILPVLRLGLGAPLAPSNANTTQDHVEAVDVASHRTIQDIAWGCLATVLACTWVAIHPNLPGCQESDWTQFKRKIVTMIYALIAPECMAAWALRQWIVARRIKRVFNKEKEEEIAWYLIIPYAMKRRYWDIRNAVNEWFRDPTPNPPNVWTLTHGFLVQMGGFVLYDDETPLRVLTFCDLMELIVEGKVDPPRIREEEINEKSKGESIAKLLVVVQTSWFIFQCLARWKEHLPVTELEVITLAFAALNIVTYGLWWKKPQGVLIAVRVQLKDSVGGTQGGGIGTGYENENLLGGIAEKGSYIVREVKEAMRSGWAGWFFLVPYHLLLAMLRPVIKLGSDWYYPSSRVDRDRRSLRVPMFYAGKTDDKDILPFLIISLSFASIHLIPWSSSFPSTVERSLWRSSTIVIIVEPILAYLSYVAFNINRRFLNRLSKSLWVLVKILTQVAAPLYILARLTLFVLAFTTLRQLHLGAYVNIEWTTFVPHI